MQDERRSNDDIYNDIVQDVISHVNTMMNIKSINNLSSDPNNEEIKRYIPYGKDLVLANLTSEVDDALFKMYTSLLVNLLLMQKQSYVKEGRMLMGIKPSLEVYLLRLINHVISTRAKGEHRERMLQANPNHRINFTKEPSTTEKLYNIGTRGG